MSEIVRKDYIFFENTIKSKDAAFRFISKKAVELRIGKNESIIFDSLVSREKEASTGLMNHIAIPHAISSNIDFPAVIFVGTQSGINDWETFDDTDVKQIIAMLVPEGAAKNHLKDIAQISTALLEDKNISIINTSNSVDDIYDVLNS